MINLLRRVRQSIIGSNKAMNYLLYALGEFVLIVAGILMALQINNWNEENNSRHVERQLLLGLKEELVTNKKELGVTLFQHQRALRSLTQVIELFGQQNKPPPEVMDSLIQRTFQVAIYTFTPRTGQLKSMINTGNIIHLQNQSLAAELSNLQDFMIEVTETHQPVHKIWHDYVSPLYNQYIQWGTYHSSYLPGKRIQQDFEGFFNDQEIERWLPHAWLWTNNIVHEEKSLMDYFEGLIVTVEEELLRGT